MVKRAGSFSILAIGRIRSSVRKSTCHDDPHSANGLVDMALSGHARQEAPLLCQISFAAIVCLVCILAKFMEKANEVDFAMGHLVAECIGSIAIASTKYGDSTGKHINLKGKLNGRSNYLRAVLALTA